MDDSARGTAGRDGTAGAGGDAGTGAAPAGSGGRSRRATTAEDRTGGPAEDRIGGPAEADPAPPAVAARTGRASDADRRAVERKLGRAPGAAFDVVTRDAAGEPQVIRNAPFLHDGTPMPTLYWLVDPGLVRAVSRLEAAGGVRRAEREVDPAALRRAHAAYAAERDSAVPAGHRGPRPHGGVGGTRTGVKCLHCHLAWFLAGGDDPVGRWTAGRLGSGEGDAPRRGGAAAGGDRTSAGSGGAPPSRGGIPAPGGGAGP